MARHLHGRVMARARQDINPDDNVLTMLPGVTNAFVVRNTAWPTAACTACKIACAKARR